MGKKPFMVLEMEQLVGKLDRLGQAYRPVYHLMSMMYRSVALSLHKNNTFLTSTSNVYCKLIKKANNGGPQNNNMR